MSYITLNDMMTSEFYLAGERVPAGVYRDIETNRQVRLETEDYLPASLDGRVAVYVCVLYTWGDTQTSIKSPALLA